MREVELIILAYLKARNCFLADAEQHPGLLSGNDNIIGRIGEYLAISFLGKKGRAAIKVKSKSEKGHDLLVGTTRISVKMLTSENARGRGLRLADPWDELLVIDFNTQTFGYSVGHLLKSHFEAALMANPGWSRNPVVKKTMLGANGLIGKYGVVEECKLESGDVVL